MAIRRRRLVLAAGLLTVLLLALGVVATMFTITRTTRGRTWLRDQVAAQLAPGVRGRLYLGAISGPILTGITVDSLLLTEADGSVMIASGPATLRWDPRDFLDRRILVKHLEATRPLVHIIKYGEGDWNYKRLFPPGKKRGPRPKGSFGDFIVVDTTVIHDGRFLLTLPWQPADSLRGARRDSAIAFNLQRRDAEIRRRGRGFARTWRWTEGQVRLSHARLAHPDTAGRRFVIASLAVEESNPPFSFREFRGDARWLGDTIWFTVPAFRLPGSRGSADGRIVWGSNLPIRYFVDVLGDEVAMRDIAWLTTTFPTEGSGRMRLAIRNDPRDLNVLRYAITDMDARSHGSRLRGRMTWGVGGPVVTLTDVELSAQPLDFKLLRVFNGEPFPFDWQGQFTGTVTARGGPLHRFDIDNVAFTFRDAHVPGAVSTGRGAGQVDINYPAFTRFRGFDLQMDRVDLRTPRFVNPEFAQLNGIARGRARLDSLWYDLRVSNLDVTHDDGTGATPSRATGSGRITLLDEYVQYDMQLEAAPLSLSMLANSYPLLPVRGSVSGPITVRGTLNALEVTGQLTGPAGALSGSGVVDADPRGGYAARAQAAFERLDLRPLTDRRAMPVTQLTGRADLDLRGATLGTLEGAAMLALGRSRVDALRVDAGTARAVFADGRMRFDTLGITSPMLHLAASGGLGLRPDRSDSLTVRASVDSLGSLRPWVTSPRADVAPDSLAGALQLRLRLAGRLDSLAGEATLRGADVLRGSLRTATLDGTATGDWVRGTLAGVVQLTADTLSVGGARFPRATGALAMRGARDGEFRLEARGDSGTRATMRAHVAAGGGDTTLVVLDTFDLVGRRSQWALVRPATMQRLGRYTLLDALELRNGADGRVTLGARIPTSDSARVDLRVTRLPLRDFAWLAPRERPLTGMLDGTLTVDGDIASPTGALDLRASALSIGETSLGDASIRGRYAAERFTGDVSLGDRSGGAPALAAQLRLPVVATLDALPQLRRDRPVDGSLTLKDAGLALFEAATPALTRASGVLNGQLALGGTLTQPRLDGALTLRGGAATVPALGVSVQGMDGELRFAGDNVVLPRLTVAGTGRTGGTAVLGGRVGFASLSDPTFDLTVQATGFRVLNRPRIAVLYVSTDASGVRLRGTQRSAQLTGSVTIPAGDIAIPELGVTKNLVSLDDPEFYALIDTTTTQGRTLLAAAPSPLLRNLEVRDVRLAMGSNVWLRSAEANIKLGGDVGVTLGRDRTDSANVQLALDGTLQAERGTYRLSLGFGSVQRTFEVERGTLRFFGEPELNPTLDITAVHTVRQYTRQDRDVPVRISIGGTLATPTLRLGSADPNLVLSESDAISYLFTGRPSYSVTNVVDRSSNTAANVLLPTIGSALGDQVARALGLDQFQIETAGGVAGQEFGLGSTLASTRLGGGVQVGARTFVRATVGLCQLFGQANGQAAQSLTLANSIGAKLEYRFTPNLSASVGLEPPTSVLQCNNSVNARNFVPTPQQFGFDLFRRWEY